MKLLLFSDLHSNLLAAQRLVERAQAVDVVIGAGDFGNAHQGVAKCIAVLKAIHCPGVLVAGNNETTDELTAACRVWPSAHVLHGSGVTIEGIPFWGLGGGVPVTPFGSWSYDFTEGEATQLLRDCPNGSVLVTHSPPQGLVDLSSRGDHLGSVAVRSAIQRVQPRLVVCGHIHASAGQ